MSGTASRQALRDGLTPLLHVLNEAHMEQEARGEFSMKKWAVIRDTGLLGLPFNERWGGLGQDLATTMFVLEGLGEGCRDAGLGFTVTTHLVSTGVAVQRFGSAALQERIMPEVCAGRIIGAHAISEPDAGSDMLAMRTRATRDGDDFVLSGVKAFVTNGPIADAVVVYARTGSPGSPLGITAFLVELGTPGLRFGPPIAKMGLRTSPLGELHLDECRVPAANVVGRVGGGFLVLDHVMKWEILCGFAVIAGEMRHRIDRCVEYARTRHQFGSAIAGYQAVAHRIVDMEVGLRAARAALYEAAEQLTAGRNVTVEIAVAKLLTSEANLASALSAVQIFGGYGYMTEYGLEQGVRDAVAGTIYSGTSEIQRNRIAAMLGLTPR